MSLKKYNALKKAAADAGIDVPRGTSLDELEKIAEKHNLTKQKRRKSTKKRKKRASSGSKSIFSGSRWR